MDDIGGQLAPLIERNRERVLAHLASLEPEAQGLLARRLRERAEQPVEDDQHEAVVLIEASLVAGVMHAMN